MDRKEFEGLDLIEQVNYINARLEKKISFNKICEEMNIPESTLRGKFKRKGYTKSAKNNRYELINKIEIKKDHIEEDDKASDSVSQVHHIKEDDKTDDNVSQAHNLEVFNGNKELLLANDKKEKLIDIIENYDKIKSLIEQYDKVMTMCDDSRLIINLPITELKDIRQTVRINPIIAEQFEEFCSKHKNFSKKELLSQALKEFMDKHK